MNGLKIGIRLESLCLPLRRALAEAARLGVKGVQVEAVGDLAPDNLTQTGRREFRNLLRTHDLELTAPAEGPSHQDRWRQPSSNCRRSIMVSGGIVIGRRKLVVFLKVRCEKHTLHGLRIFVIDEATFNREPLALKQRLYLFSHKGFGMSTGVEESARLIRARPRPDTLVARFKRHAILPFAGVPNVHYVGEAPDPR
jgi:hypothetical protein